jgi:DnaJ-class molecular chaperone
MTNFDKIEEARQLLGLGETATLKEIKSAYRRMSRQYHPDKHAGPGVDDTEIMKKINWAYELLMDYCTKYRYCFHREDIARVYPEEEFFRDWHEKWFDSI